MVRATTGCVEPPNDRRLPSGAQEFSARLFSMLPMPSMVKMLARAGAEKGLERPHGYTVQRPAASRAASRIASTMLPASALPWRAMSNAVP